MNAQLRETDGQPTLADEIAAVANIKRQHGWDSAEIVESCRRMAEELKRERRNDQ